MKLAVITGASSGIGAATARQLAAEGYRVALVARTKAALDQLAAEIGPQAVAYPCDASDGAAVLAMAEQIRRDLGVPDVIVNSAGAGLWKWVEDTSPAEAVAMMQAPYFAAFNLTHAFMRDMLNRNSGVIIHVGSPASLCPMPSGAGYNAARWALRGLHESLKERYPDDKLPELREYIGGASRFFIERAFDDTIVRTASPERMVHLEQVLANDGGLAELSRQRRLEMAEPSRG